MTHTLIIANDFIGPRMAGPSIRAWELCRALHAKGLAVTLAAPGVSAPTSAQADGRGNAQLPDAPFPIVIFDARGEALRKAAEEADSILMQGLVLAHFPFLVSLDKPLIVDIYDPFVFENLAQRSGESMVNRTRSHASDLGALNDQLLRGDFFLCASEQQRDYWLGMLTALGRVNPATYDADPGLRNLIDVMPFGFPDDPPRPTGKPVLRGVVPGIGPDDRILLWGGGIWNWFDPLTLIRAVAEVARSEPRLRLYFFGSDPPTLYTPKLAMAAKAEALTHELGLTDRVVFFNHGWVPYAERINYLFEADLGVSAHLPHVETHFAFRTRLMDCLWTGLPMVVTEGDVLADLVRTHNLGRTVPAQDVPATAAALREMLAELDRIGRSGFADRFAAVHDQLTWSHAAGPLARFAANPVRAADRPTGEGAAGQHAYVGPTPLTALPSRALEILREGGPLLLAEEAVRYVRWVSRPR